MKTPENFVPLFKERDAENQFFYQDGKWVKCSEPTIDFLWNKWVVSKNTERFDDEEGFTVFGNIVKNEA
jgi:hypothetical protein